MRRQSDLFRREPKFDTRGAIDCHERFQVSDIDNMRVIQFAQSDMIVDR